MKTIKSDRPAKGYEAPQIVCIDIDHEGVLCSSSEDFVIDEDWGDLM